MKIQSTTNQQPAFGWNKTTHAEMTLLALKDNNLLSEKEKRMLSRYSQMPDFDKKERGYFCNTHFFFPNSTEGVSFGKGADRYNNAYSRFKELLQRSILSHNKDDFLKYMGYTVHYLQDMSTPLHTESGGLIQKVLKYKTHKDFERGKKYGATANIAKLKNEYKPESVNFSSLLDLFIGTSIFSSRPEFKVSMFNKKEWARIQQACFNKGVDTSRELFDRLTNLVRYQFR